MHLFRTINRSIVTKTVALILAVVCFLVVALILTSRSLVLTRFAALEREDATTQIQRARNEIEATLDKLQAFTSDWSFWDDSYRFVADHNPGFVDNNLMDQTFIDQRLNLMLFFNTRGQIIHQQFFNLVNAKPSAPDTSTIEAIVAVSQLVRDDPDSTEIRTGILVTPIAPLLLVSCPILPSLRNEPSRGRLLAGRYLNQSEVERISTMIQSPLAVHALVPTGAAAQPDAPGEVTTAIVDNNTLLASTVLADITGQPRLTVTMSLARTIFRQGYVMWKQHAVSAALLGFFFVVVLVLLLNRIVLRKLVGMAQEIDRIKENGGVGQEVTVRGEDEIAYLAGKINAMLAALRRLNESQEEKEFYLKRVLDTINCGVMVVDAENRQVVAINHAGATLLNRHVDDVIGHICHTFVCPQTPHDCPVLDRVETIDLSERLILRDDGTPLPVLKSVAGIEREGRKYLIESFVDISPLKEAEAALRAGETRYRRFFDEDLTGDFIVSVEGEIIDCNLAYARMFGYETVEEIKRTNVINHYPVAANREIFLERIRKERRLERYESELRRRDGSPIYCIGNEIGEFDDQGQLVCIRGYLFDDTKRVLLEREIRQNQKLEAIGTLAGGIAHDFNNILAGIIGYAELLLMKEPANSRVRDYMGKILAAGEKARELIYQILAFSRKTETSLQPVPLESVVQEVMQMLRATLPATIAIEERLHADAMVMADPVQIHQIVLNLCTNAGHAMRERGGTLTIALEQVWPDASLLAQNPQLSPSGYARISIEDTGHGIPESIRNRVFDPFFTTKSKDEGTGLGLSVVHGIVQGLKGSITVASTPGQGTRFDVYLPLTDRVAEVVMPEKVRPASGKEHIVYVDDDPFLVEIGKEMLLDLGYRVTTFTDSGKALTFLGVHRSEVGLVISDLTMPGLTGIGLARSLCEAGVAIPMMIYTGYQDDLAGENLDLLGIREVLLKPITPQVLGARVREVLDRGREKTGVV